MGHRLRMLKARGLIRVLNLLGFSKARQSGSHAFFRHPDSRSTVVPIHGRKDIDRKLLKLILEEIGLSLEEFEKYL